MPLGECVRLFTARLHAAVERLDEGLLYLVNLLFAVLPVGTVH